MKSKTSSFNPTVFKKDLTRFAPAWGCCLIFMGLVLISMANEPHAYFRLQTVRDCITAFSWINMIYGAVVAQLLFGDLFNARICNALHALPLRRESWFATHTAAGLAFSLIPNVIITLAALPVLRLGSGSVALFWWLLAAQLQYLFFFGTAVLCMMLTGNRFGQTVFYIIIQFGAVMVFWLVTAVYQPFLHGVQFSEEPFLRFSPLATLSSGRHDMLIIDFERIENAAGELENYIIYGVQAGNGWGYLVICAGLGILALLAALALYRKRKLECAGDFVAFSAMEPVVTVIVTVFAGSVFHLFADAFGMNLRSVMLGTGMVVGFFICRMLLERTTKVFRKKAFLFCGTIVAVFGLTVLLTFLDPAGITRYVPAAEDVESVTVGQSYSLHSYNSFPYTTTDPEEIAALQQVHQLGITKQSNVQPGGTEELYSPYELRIEYKLKNGKVVNRFYTVQPQSEAGQIMKGFFTRTDCVIGIPESRLPDAAAYLRTLYTPGRDGKEQDLSGLDIEGLFEAIAADCRAGNMVQFSGYHYPQNYDLLGLTDVDGVVVYLELGFDRQLLDQNAENDSTYGPTLRYTSVRVYVSCVHTLGWMEDNGLLTEDMKLIMEDGSFFQWG